MRTTLCSLLAAALVLAAPAALSQTHTLPGSVVASGGTDATSGSLRLHGTVGGIAGRVGEGSTVLHQGFWKGAESVESGVIYVVNTTADPGTGTCNASECALRAAITAANAHANGSGRDQIHFAIPGAGLHTIVPVSALPTITDPVLLDGYTQPGARPNTRAVGNDAVLRIEISGTGAAFSALVVTAGNSTVRGLVINRFNGNGAAYGIRLQTGGGNVITGNWIGVDATGAAALANNSGGLHLLNSAGNRIGGTLPADRNVIVGAGNTAIYEEGAGGSHTIQGNYVGTNAAGTEALARGGVWLTSSGNLIGGTAPGAGNVLATGAVPGIQLYEQGASGNTIQGNYIGVTADGKQALTPASGGTGIAIQRAGGNLVGGSTAAARNVITSNGGAILLFGSPTDGTGNTIQGNYIGTNPAGTATLLSSRAVGSGIRVEGAGKTRVGGTEPGEGNVIAGFAFGVLFYSSQPGSIVQGNFIGTNAAGTAALPNAEGIVFGGLDPADDNTIGGTKAGARNVISGNTGDGIRISKGSGNTIQGNFIGVAADGKTALGNGGHGVEIGASDRNVIGGTASGAGNVIAYNGAGSGRGHGILIYDGKGNAIEGNAIYANAHIAINLYGGDAPDGATANDPGDADTGSNKLQNTPEITSATVAGGKLTIGYRVDTDPAHATYPLRVEFFRAFEGAGGAAFLGADTYSAADRTVCGAPPCPKVLTLTPAAALSLTDFVVATATDAEGNTSEFSAKAFDVPIEEAPYLPVETALHAPRPNPSTGRAVLGYDLAEAGAVRLVVYDLLGREVAVVVEAERAAGRYEASLEREGLASGLYFVRLTAGHQSLTQRLTVLR